MMKDLYKKLTILLILAGFTLVTTGVHASNLEREHASGVFAYRLYFLSQDGERLESEVRVEPNHHHPVRTALELLLAGPHNPTLQKILPEQLQIRNVWIKDSTAYVDIGQSVQKSRLGGSTLELLIVQSIVATLTELPDIESVQILVEGQMAATLLGHVDISNPIKKTTFK